MAKIRVVISDFFFRKFKIQCATKQYQNAKQDIEGMASNTISKGDIHVPTE
jgi:hypothetical protein